MALKKCPKCGSSEIKTRKMAASMGSSRTIGVGVSASGDAAVGLGFQKTDFARKAGKQSKNDKFQNVMQFFGVFTVIGMIVGGIIGKIFGVPQYLVAFGGVAGFGFAFWLSTDISFKDDAKAERESFENDWICEACGNIFRNQ